MNRRIFLSALPATAAAPALANETVVRANQSRFSALPPTGLLCELLEQPERTSITTRQPRFGWIVNDGAANAMQSAYHILVAASREAMERDRGELWDSGKVASAESVNLPYRGQPLAADSRYWWKVRTWNQRGQVSGWSQPQQFRTGTLSDEHATARYPLELQEIAPLRVVKKGDGHYFIEFAKTAFGTLRLTLDGTVAANLTIELSEHRAGPDEIWRPSPTDIRARSSIGYFKTVLGPIKTLGDRRPSPPSPLPPAGEGGSALKRITVRPPNHVRPRPEELPEGVPQVMPFRCVEITGCPIPLTRDHVRQLALFYRFNDEAARFTSSSTVLNDVWELCKYTMKATSFCGVYVDGHRERLPYEADAYINQLGHYGVDREFTLARHSHEWLITHPTWPTEWITHSVLMAWVDYLHTGDDRSLRHYYRDLEAKTLAALARDDGLVSTSIVPEDVLKSIHFNGRLRDIVDWPLGERDGYEMKPINTVVNAFHCESLALMSRLAEAVGRREDAVRYRAQADRVQRGLVEKLFDPQRGLFVDGEGSTHASLHANMFPLAFGLVPAAHQRRVVDFIKRKGMACSVYGAQYLLEALYRAGEDEAAFALLTSREERSWAHMLEVGTTITLEAWDNRFKPNQDWNHAWGAAPANLIPRFLMGVRPLEPGFRKVLIQPQPGPLARADLTLPTIRGPLRVAFDQVPGRSFQLRIVLPSNMVAKVCVPKLDRTDDNVRVDGRTRRGAVEGRHLCLNAIGSGAHVIER